MFDMSDVVSVYSFRWWIEKNAFSFEVTAPLCISKPIMIFKSSVLAFRCKLILLLRLYVKMNVDFKITSENEWTVLFQMVADFSNKWFMPNTIKWFHNNKIHTNRWINIEFGWKNGLHRHLMCNRQHQFYMISSTIEAYTIHTYNI